MKTMIAAVVALAMGTGIALADGAGNGPVAPNTPFTIGQCRARPASRSRRRQK